MNNSIRLDLACVGLVVSVGGGCLAQPALEPSQLDRALFPCDVAGVLEKRCVECHSAPPTGGAPMSLMTVSDFQKPAVSSPEETVGDLALQRIHNARRPMPPNGTLAPGELESLDGFLVGGATGVPESEGCAPRMPDMMPSAVTCPDSERLTLVAHSMDDVNDGFPVAAASGSTYVCFAWRSPFTRPTHGTAFGGMIDKGRVLHHLTLYETSTPQEEGSVELCRIPADARLLAAWEPGWAVQSMPEDVGVVMPTSEKWLLLEVHYNSPEDYPTVLDRSGFAICATENLRPHPLDVTILRTPIFTIPPAVNDYPVSGRCTPQYDGPIHILWSALHMHNYGISANTRILRHGMESATDTVIDVPHWDRNYQQLAMVDLQVEPGDVVKTQCNYLNETDHSVGYGENASDEMCVNFVFAWPANALALDKANHTCVDP